MPGRLHQFIDKVEDRLMALGDRLLEVLPRPVLAPKKFHDLRIIAHRGSRENGARENTFDSFDHAVKAGVWGLEFDLRFTSCGQAVIHHDETSVRVFNQKIVVAETSFTRLRKEIALVPTLQEVLERYAGRAHFMIEIKTVLDRKQREALREALQHLEPGRDYHLMTLNVRRFQNLSFLPPAALIPIAEFNTRRLSNLALRENWGGLAGQYFMLGHANIARHHAAGQKIGTGFINTTAALAREIHRGVDWIYTDRPHRILDFARSQI